jgi:hypothetical protein
MPITYVNIASTTLGSNQNTVTFSSISSAYTDLVVRISARSTRSGATFASLYGTFNNAAGLTSNTSLIGSGSTATNLRDSNSNDLYLDVSLPGATATASTFGNAEIYIGNYTSTSPKQCFSFAVMETNSGTAYMNCSATLVRSTSGINSIVFNTQNTAANFVAGSSFYLYGIKNS